ncbi:MAG TPA: TGS domain-containing protein, partial [Phycisphaerae bacterium]|nr:TGS domain-containing protein [Phycisphaerae bacterium]
MSVTIRLPDGNEKKYDHPVEVIQVAEDISPGLARAAMAAELDGKLCDTSTAIAEGVHELRILTNKDDESLEVLRHTTAHVLAQAVTELFGPEVQYTIGPALTDDFQYGFYYDFSLPQSIGIEDLAKIEKKMKEIISAKLPIERIVLPVDQAKEQFEKLGQDYKVEMINDLVTNEAVETLSLYKQADFVDMCRGPHLGNTGKIKAFKLLSTAGAYWRGDEKNQMLTRIYGTAFFDRKELNAHIERIAEAKKRDHRIIGKQLGLFHFSDAVGPGLPLWKPKGAVIRRELEDWLRGELIKRGYDSVYTPHIGKLELYETSGHYPYYEHGLFPTIQLEDGSGYLLKPM